MLRRIILCLVLGLLSGSGARADSLYGTCKYQDGSKVDGMTTISTSWDGKKVQVKNGTYRLDFGGPVDRTITVYVNRRWYKIVLVRGATRLDIVLPTPPKPKER